MKQQGRLQGRVYARCIQFGRATEGEGEGSLPKNYSHMSNVMQIEWQSQKCCHLTRTTFNVATSACINDWPQTVNIVRHQIILEISGSVCGPRKLQNKSNVFPGRVAQKATKP